MAMPSMLQPMEKQSCALIRRSTCTDNSTWCDDNVQQYHYIIINSLACSPRLVRSLDFIIANNLHPSMAGSGHNWSNSMNSLLVMRGLYTVSRELVLANAVIITMVTIYWCCHSNIPDAIKLCWANEVCVTVTTSTWSHDHYNNKLTWLILHEGRCYTITQITCYLLVNTLFTNNNIVSNNLLSWQLANLYKSFGQWNSINLITVK